MKSAIVLTEGMPAGLLANATACITSGLFNDETAITGPLIEGKECNFISITKIPILILKQSNKPWKELLKRAQRNKLKYMLFTKEAQSTTSYTEYENRVKGKSIDELQVIGIGVLGEDSAISSFSGDLPLLR